MKIHKLPQEVINQIAAGEVVERPASVIKELVENAIDAQATHIDVLVEHGGIDSITVTDNGVGMSPENAQLSLESHATSKLQSIDDLSRIATLGFRGEALASIASVSEFSLETREHDSVSGTKIEKKDLDITVSECGTPAGTSIHIHNLFLMSRHARNF